MHAPQHIIKKTFSHSEEDCGLYPILCIHNIKQGKFLVRLSLATRTVKILCVSFVCPDTYDPWWYFSLFVFVHESSAGRSCVLCSVY